MIVNGKDLAGKGNDLFVYTNYMVKTIVLNTQETIFRFLEIIVFQLNSGIMLGQGWP